MSYPFDCITNFIFVENRPEAADIILVPGSDQPQLMERAAELYNRGLAPFILPSGGPNANLPQYPSEWEFLRQIALKAGVPDRAILREDRAKNTFENAFFSCQLLKEKGMEIKKAIMVCKGYHSRRALMTYKARLPESIEYMVSPIIDDTGITKDNWFLDKEKIHMVMQEVVKIGSYFTVEIDGMFRRYGVK